MTPDELMEIIYDLDGYGLVIADTDLIEARLMSVWTDDTGVIKRPRKECEDGESDT